MLGFHVLALGGLRVEFNFAIIACSCVILCTCSTVSVHYYMYSDLL